MTQTLTVVLDRSRRVAGHLLRHAKGWSAYDANDRLVGQAYSTPDSAISALLSLSVPST
jgi:hypothetical protein